MANIKVKAPKIPFLSEFLEYLSVERGYSVHTIEAYNRDIAQLAEFLFLQHKFESRIKWKDLSKDHLYEFQKNLSTKEYKPSTRSRKLASLKSFLGYLHRTGHINNDPSEKISLRVNSLRLPHTISIDQAIELVTKPLSISSTPAAARDEAMLQLAYASGLRSSEIINLNLGDVDLKANRVRCMGKGNKERIIPFHSLAANRLDGYLNSSRMLLATKLSGTALFLNSRGGRITRQGYWLTLKKYAHMLNMGDDITPHSLRHSFATHLLQGGAPIRHVQELLGHASISSTQIYTHLTKEFVREEYETAHPRS